MTQAPQPRPAEQEGRLPPEENIDLQALWQTLVTYKWLVIGCMIVSVAAVLVATLGRESTFTYRTSIEIGKSLVTSADGEKIQKPLESANLTLAKVNETYIPVARNEIAEDASSPPPEVTARVPKAGEILLLESRGTSGEKPLHEQIHERVLRYIVEDHDAQQELSRRELDDRLKRLRLELARLESPAYQKLVIGTIENKIARARIELDKLTDERLIQETEQRLKNNIASNEAALKGLQNQKRLLEEKRQAIAKRKALIEEEIAELERFIANTGDLKRQTTGHTPDSTQAVATLLLDNSIHRARERLATLKRNLNVDLDIEAQQLSNQIAANALQQEKLKREIDIANSALTKERASREKKIRQQELAIAQLELELDKEKVAYENRLDQLRAEIEQTGNDLALIVPTHTITPTVTIENQSLSTPVLVVLALVLGAFIGGLLALVVAAVKGREEQPVSP